MGTISALVAGVTFWAVIIPLPKVSVRYFITPRMTLTHIAEIPQPQHYRVILAAKSEQGAVIRLTTYSSAVGAIGYALAAAQHKYSQKKSGCFFQKVHFHSKFIQ